MPSGGSTAEEDDAAEDAQLDLLFPPPRGKRMSAAPTIPHRLYDALGTATTEAGLAEVMEWETPWYQATRHTFASHWIGSGRPIAQVAAILGHSTTWVTERYAHAAADPDGADLLAFGERTGSGAARPRRQVITHARGRGGTG